MFKGISLSLKGALWTAAGIIIVAAGVYAAWQLTDDDAEKEEQGVETTGQTVSEPEQVGTDQQDEEDSEEPTTTTTTAPVEDQPDEEDSEEPTTTTTTAPVEDQPDEEDSEEPTTTTTTAPVEDQPDEEDSEEPTTTTTTAPVENQEEEEVSEDPVIEETPVSTEDQTGNQEEEDQVMHPNRDLAAQNAMLLARVMNCLFDIQTGECRYIIDGWDAEKIILEYEKLYGYDCDPDPRTGYCRAWDSWTPEMYEQRMSELVCLQDWYFSRQDWLCHSTPQ